MAGNQRPGVSSDNIELWKKTLQDRIKNAQKTLNELIRWNMKMDGNQDEVGTNDNIEVLKKNLLKEIQNTQRTLNELDSAKKSNERPQIKNTRGSKSLMNLSTVSSKLNSTVEKNSQPQGQSRGKRRSSSRSRSDSRGQGGAQSNVGKCDSRERGGTYSPCDPKYVEYVRPKPPPLLGKRPPLLGEYPQFLVPHMKNYPERNPYTEYAPPFLGEYHNRNFGLLSVDKHPPSLGRNGKISPALPDSDGYRLLIPPDTYKTVRLSPRDDFGNRTSLPTYVENMKGSQVSFPPEQVKSGNMSNTSLIKKSSKPKLTAEDLVKVLALFRGQFATTEILERQVESDPATVLDVVKSRKDLFVCVVKGKDTIIELVPKIALCFEYLSHDDCTSWETCKKLHICKTYVTDFCDSGSACQYGHRWDTNHNNAILSKLYLDLIDQETLHQVVNKVCKDPFKLQICRFYNTGSWCVYGDNCSQLHICKHYVLGIGKCSKKECSLNHNMVAPQCQMLFKDSGVPVNKDTRSNILMHLASSIEEWSGQQLEMPCYERNAEEKGKTDKKVKPTKENEKSRTIRSSGESDDSKCTDDFQDKNRQAKPPKNINRNQISKKTCKATDVLGDVEIPEICLSSIDDECKNEKNGCKYLHSKNLYHWQFERSGKWYNFCIFQSKILENAYQDVSKGFIQVPALDQSKLEEHAKELLNILGTDSWKADFQGMEMTSNKINVKIRRVSMQSSVVSSSSKATVFEWYFKDDQGKWIQYGQVDCLGKEQLACSISSEDIEKQYVLDPSSSMIVCNAHYKYKLNFSKMTQENVQTDKEREIRRRPSRLSYQKKSSIDNDPSSAFPVHWYQMTVNQTHLLVLLDPSSAEYLEASSRLRLTLPTANIQKIQRLQNPYLWRLSQYKKAALSRRYDNYQMNMQRLFHGINPKDIDTICKENFDWRQGITVQQNYGQGTYFSNSAAVARSHCTPDTHGRIFMFLAQVIIGAVVKGDPSYTRPPSNSSTNALYDTTVDDETAPTIFVKYDKEEYYPEYVMEFY